MTSGGRLHAQQGNGISPQAIAQIQALNAEKESRTPVQQKIDSNLIYASKMAAGQAIANGVSRLMVNLPDSTFDTAVVDVRTEVTPALLERIVVEHLRHGRVVEEAVFHRL